MLFDQKQSFVALHNFRPSLLLLTHQATKPYCNKALITSPNQHKTIHLNAVFSFYALFPRWTIHSYAQQTRNRKPAE